MERFSDLNIPHYYPYYLVHYPRYQQTACDVRTGLLFYSYACEKTSTNVAMVTYLLGHHLARCGVDLSQVTWQNDNGSEFIGAWNNKHGPTLYETILQQMQSQNVRIPSCCKTYNTDVETSHASIENEFYDVEDYQNLRDFLNKAFTYSVYFNYQRKFCYKGGRTPIEIMKEYSIPTINTDLVGSFLPLIRDFHIKARASSLTRISTRLE